MTNIFYAGKLIRGVETHFAVFLMGEHISVSRYIQTIRFDDWRDAQEWKKF